MRSTKAPLNLAAFAAIVILVASCGAKLPQAEVAAANAAFADAKTAQADVYAADSFAAAAAANDALQTNLEAKDYKKSKDLAKALLDASAKAKEDAAAGSAAAAEVAKGEIATLDANVDVLVKAVQTAYDKAVKAGNKANIDLAPTKARLDAAPAVRAAAAATVEANPLEAKKQLENISLALAASQSELEAAGFRAGK